MALGERPKNASSKVSRLTPVKRFTPLRQLCESSEYRTKTASQVRVTQVYAGMLRRAPDTSGYNYWTNKDATSSTGLLQLIKTIRTGSSYANRF